MGAEPAIHRRRASRMAWEPRLLTRAQAAYHCGTSEAEFLEEVARGIYPASLLTAGGERWDRDKLDEAIDARSIGLSSDWRGKAKVYGHAKA